jgi:hypothetical protein
MIRSCRSFSLGRRHRSGDLDGIDACRSRMRAIRRADQDRLQHVVHQRLAPNGRSALLAQRIWEEETNAKGGILTS